MFGYSSTPITHTRSRANISKAVIERLSDSFRRSCGGQEKALPFSKLTEVTLTRRNIVQYTFEIKEGIQEVLKESEPEP